MFCIPSARAVAAGPIVGHFKRMQKDWTYYLIPPVLPLFLGAAGALFLGVVSGVFLSLVLFDGSHSAVCGAVVGPAFLVCAVTVFLMSRLSIRRFLYRMLTVLTCVLFAVWLGGGLGAMVGLAVGGEASQFGGWLAASVICMPVAAWLGWRIGARYPFGK